MVKTSEALQLENLLAPEELLAALKQQVSGYQRLNKLADQQHDFVQRGQVEALLDLLARRQRVLDEIAKLEAILAPAKRKWSDYAAAMEPGLRQAAEQALADTRRLLEQITNADRNDAMVLQQRKLNLGRQITKAVAAIKVNRHYAVSAYGQGRGPSVDFKQ